MMDLSRPMLAAAARALVTDDWAEKEKEKEEERRADRKRAANMQRNPRFLWLVVVGRAR
jgi:hypothetical protein